MSLKTKVSKKDQLKKLSEGQIVKGTVQRTKDFGIFVQLQNSSLVGFVHKSDLSDKFVKNITEAYTQGQGEINIEHRRMLSQPAISTYNA